MQTLKALARRRDDEQRDVGRDPGRDPGRMPVGRTRRSCCGECIVSTTGEWFIEAPILILIRNSWPSRISKSSMSNSDVPSKATATSMRRGRKNARQVRLDVSDKMSGLRR